MQIDYVSIALAALAGGIVTLAVSVWLERSKKKARRRNSFIQVMGILDDLESRLLFHQRLLSDMVEECDHDPANSVFYLIHTLRHVPDFSPANTLVEHVHILSDGEITPQQLGDFVAHMRISDEWRYQYERINAIFSDNDKTFVKPEETERAAERLIRNQMDVVSIWQPTIANLATCAADCRELKVAVQEDFAKACGM